MTELPEDALLPVDEAPVPESLYAIDLATTPYTEVPDAQFIRIDLYPANAELRDENGNQTQFFPNVRLVLTDSYASIFADGPGDPVRVLLASLTGFQGSNREGYTAYVPGGTIYFKRSTGCGCGSRLRGVRPYPYAPQVPLSIF